MECLLCSGKIIQVCVQECGHLEICSECWFKMRYFSATSKCPICRKKPNHIFVTPSPSKSYSEFCNQLKNKKTCKLVFEKNSRMHFEDKAEFYRIQKLTKVVCKQCSKVFESYCELDQHVLRAHKSHLCLLCLENCKMFALESEFFGASQYQQHLKKNHVQCSLCPEYRFDTRSLRKHNEMKHYLCNNCEFGYEMVFGSPRELSTHIREMHSGFFEEESEDSFVNSLSSEESFDEYICTLCFQTFDELNELEYHQNLLHYVCKNQNCIQKNNHLFKTKNELKVHNKNKHPRINLGFRLRNSSEMQPQVQRTQHNPFFSAEEFPSLQGAPKALPLHTYIEEFKQEKLTSQELANLLAENKSTQEDFRNQLSMAGVPPQGVSQVLNKLFPSNLESKFPVLLENIQLLSCKLIETEEFLGALLEIVKPEETTEALELIKNKLQGNPLLPNLVSEIEKRTQKPKLKLVRLPQRMNKRPGRLKK
mmetsp:Transcript_4176/g.6308  ORF Transcript_4176/g.6308 Transcript_4176/m.6308 type:complete len:479 (+) Transcript_4176:580-2016(+)